MMEGQGILLICIFVPLIGAFFLPLVGKVSPTLRNILALAFVLVAFISAAVALPNAMSSNPLLFRLELPLGMSFGFFGDGLAVFMAMTASFIGAIIVFYSFGYMEHFKNQNEYYMMVVLFLGAMMGLVFSTNLIFIYLFWEISAICCWRLIGFFREKYIILRADKAFLVTVAGALMMLLGFIAIYTQTGSFDLMDIKGTHIPNYAMVLILFGILSKSATLPLHTWLADAGVAPSPVTSLLHAAVLVKIGVYVFARLFLVNFEVDVVWHTVVPIICAVSALVSAGAALVENDMKRIIAYSTVSQLAFIFLGLSCGSMLGAAGGILYILMHGLAKGGLFLCAGIVEHTVHTKDIRKMGGLFKQMPITAMAFIVCAFSVMGIPPFGGFFSKYLVINGAITAGEPWIAFTYMLGAVLTVIYLTRIFVKIFMGEEKYPDVKEGNWEMVSSVAALGLLSLLAGIFINIPSSVVTVIINSMNTMGW